MRENLRFFNGADYFELGLVEVLEGTPCEGDARMMVKISSKGFMGENAFWVTSEDLQNFCGALRNLEQTRIGEASLRSMSPGEFELKIFAVDSTGHMAIEGETSRQSYGEGTPAHIFLHSVTFGFGFSPDQLLEAVKVEWISKAAR